MEEINIQKEKAIERTSMFTATSGIFSFVLLTIIFNFLTGSLNTLLSFFISFVPHFIYYLNKKITINSLKYEIDNEESILINSYNNIMGIKNKDSSRLQVVNNIQVGQSIPDKLFGLYYVDIDYGFSSDGYVHTFKYLDEKTAEMIVSKIKPKGNLIKIK